MTREPQRQRDFKRFETDDEFRDRLMTAGVESWRVYAKKEAELDDIGWARKKMQRRLIWDTTKQERPER